MFLSNFSDSLCAHAFPHVLVVYISRPNGHGEIANGFEYSEYI